MGRLVRVNGIPNKHRLSHVLDSLGKLDAVAHCDYHKCLRSQFGHANKPIWRVSFKTRSAYLPTIIASLQSVGVGEMYGEIDISATLCSSEILPKALSLQRKRRAGFWSCCPSALDRMSTLEIHTSIVEASHINFDHVMCVLLASGIAAVGLLTDSSAFILASFFISPLMNMILAATWGLVIKQQGLLYRGLRNMFYGALICFLSGMLIGAILGLMTLHEQSNPNDFFWEEELSKPVVAPLANSHANLQCKLLAV